jgi:hypothetical protein
MLVKINSSGITIVSTNDPDYAESQVPIEIQSRALHVNPDTLLIIEIIFDYSRLEDLEIGPKDRKKTVKRLVLKGQKRINFNGRFGDFLKEVHLIQSQIDLFTSEGLIIRKKDKSEASEEI